MTRLDLDALKPDGHEFVKDGKVYKVPGAVPMQTIIEAVKIDTKIEQAAATDDGDAVSAATEDLFDLVTDLMRDADPNVDLGGEEYTDGQRERLAKAIEDLTGMTIQPEAIGDDTLEAAGVKRVAGIRLSLDEMTLILGLVVHGEGAVHLATALKAALVNDDLRQQVLDAEANGNGAEAATVPPTTSKAPRSRKVSGAKPTRSSSAKRSRSRSSA